MPSSCPIHSRPVQHHSRGKKPEARGTALSLPTERAVPCAWTACHEMFNVCMPLWSWNCHAVVWGRSKAAIGQPIQADMQFTKHGMHKMQALRLGVLCRPLSTSDMPINTSIALVQSVAVCLCSEVCGHPNPGHFNQRHWANYRPGQNLSVGE